MVTLTKPGRHDGSSSHCRRCHESSDSNNCPICSPTACRYSGNANQVVWSVQILPESPKSRMTVPAGPCVWYSGASSHKLLITLEQDNPEVASNQIETRPTIATSNSSNAVDAVAPARPNDLPTQAMPRGCRFEFPSSRTSSKTYSDCPARQPDAGEMCLRFSSLGFF